MIYSSRSINKHRKTNPSLCYFSFGRNQKRDRKVNLIFCVRHFLDMPIANHESDYYIAPFKSSLFFMQHFAMFVIIKRFLISLHSFQYICYGFKSN
jgi:hypothetical protein